MPHYSDRKAIQRLIEESNAKSIARERSKLMFFCNEGLWCVI